MAASRYCAVIIRIPLDTRVKLCIVCLSVTLCMCTVLVCKCNKHRIVISFIRYMLLFNLKSTTTKAYSRKKEEVLADGRYSAFAALAHFQAFQNEAYLSNKA